MDDFVKTRLNPALHTGYYSTLLNKDEDSLKVKQIRDSFVYFRSSSTPNALEGVDRIKSMFTINSTKQAKPNNQ